MFTARPCTILVSRVTQVSLRSQRVVPNACAGDDKHEARAQAARSTPPTGGPTLRGRASRRDILTTATVSGASGALWARLGVDPPSCRPNRLLPPLPDADDLQARLRLALEARTFNKTDCAQVMQQLYHPKIFYHDELRGDVRGLAALQRYAGLWAKAGVMRQVQLHHVAVQSDTGFAAGTCTFEPKLGRPFQYGFTTCFTFDERGMILTQREMSNPGRALLDFFSQQLV